MKLTTILILLCSTVCSSAQFKYSYNTNGFSSFFQKLEKGNFKGYADGLLQLEFKDGTKYLESISKDSAHLDIISDPGLIYDVSYKNYFLKTNHLQIEYITYNKANAFLITLDNKVYIFSLIDGASLGVIDGLGYEYVMNGETELLIIHFSDKVALYGTRQYSSIRAYSITSQSPELYVLKGSTLIFHIRK